MNETGQCKENTLTGGVVNTFITAVLNQVMAYITTHADEIVQMILDLLKGAHTTELKNSVDTFVALPTHAAFNAMFKEATKAGADAGQIAAVIVNKVTVTVPEKS